MLALKFAALVLGAGTRTKFSRGRPLTTRAVLARTLSFLALVIVSVLMAWLVYGTGQ